MLCFCFSRTHRIGRYSSAKPQADRGRRIVVKRAFKARDFVVDGIAVRFGVKGELRDALAFGRGDFDVAERKARGIGRKRVFRGLQLVCGAIGFRYARVVAGLKFDDVGLRPRGTVAAYTNHAVCFTVAFSVFVATAAPSPY